MEREFKGVWIPAELWLDEELSMLDKVIYTEIDSLDNENHCTASNKYFAEFCHVSESAVTKSISKLKALGMVEEVEFTGRVRRLAISFRRGCLVKKTRLPSKKDEAASENLRTINIYNNTDNRNKTNNKIISTKSSSKKLVKKKSLYESCMDLINLYTKDKPELFNLLVQYLNMRLEMKEKPLYKNQWKGILNKLDKIHEEDGTPYEDIIQFSIDRGYASFFPVPKYSGSKKKKAYDSGVSCDKYTEEEMKEIREWQKEMIAKGEKMVY